MQFRNEVSAVPGQLLDAPLQPQQPLCAALAVVVIIARHFLIDDVEQDLELLWVLLLAGPQPLQQTTDRCERA